MNILVTHDNIEKIVDENLMFHDMYGVDTETYGLKWEHGLFLLIIADFENEYLFNFHPYPDMAPEYILGTQHIPIIDRFFKTKSTKCAHNAKFDMRKIARFGFTVKPEDYYCTYAQERVLKNNYFGQNAYRLEGLAARRGWKKDDKVMEYLKKHKCYSKEKLPGKKTEVVNYHFEQAPFHLMRHYAGVDARLHYNIAKDQLKTLAEMEKATAYPSQRRVFFNERNLTGVCFKAEMEGIRIDRDYTQRALEFELNGLRNEEEEFKLITGERFVDSRVLLERVFTKAGEAFPVTEKGNASFAGSVLEEMDSPIAGIVNNIRYLDKRINTYYANFLYHSQSDGLIHADMRQGGTETGRFSYRDPNLQNLSKEDSEEDLKKEFLIRQCFIPKEGKLFFMLDYRQQEFRMMLDYAGEKKLIEDINSGADVHQATADLIGITRNQAKTINFGLLYGMGVEKLARSLGISIQEARDLRNYYFSKLPRVQKFIREVSDRGAARGFIHNWFGRRNYIANSDWSYILPNHLIQGGCADVVKKAMNLCDTYITENKLSTKLLVQVHDELLFELPPNEATHMLEIAKIMESVYKPMNGMKLTTSMEHSLKSWGQRDKIKGMYVQ